MTSARQTVEELLDFIDSSPSPWHAVDVMRAQLEGEGFEALREQDEWSLAPGKSYYVVRDGSSIIAFRVGHAPEQGWRIVGAHTDSPGFRVKARPEIVRGGILGLGVEVYGGPIIATFADRDLTLAGRVWCEADGKLQPKLLNFARPLVRLPTPAIHLNREVNEQGLRFDAQEELALVLTGADATEDAQSGFRELLATELAVEEGAVRSWEIAVADTQPGAFFGARDEFIASSQLDNLASCHAALRAFLEVDAPAGISLVAFFDHEEIGSQSYKGAEGTFLPDVMERVLQALELTEDAARLRASSMVLSADMAHAYHPSFGRFYDEAHALRLNGGPVIKINAKQRYATEGAGESYFGRLCELEGVPHQKYVHRNNLPCGSTIGPIVAARLGIRTVDVGNPMWSMHSVRETAGVEDHEMMIRVMRRFFADGDGPGQLA